MYLLANQRRNSNPEIVVSDLLTTQKGLGVLVTPELKVIKTAIKAHGLKPAPEEVIFSIDASAEGDVGKMHRHTAGGLIVHQTVTGTGVASMIWSDTSSDIDPHVIKPDITYDFSVNSILVFASESWHQFNTPPNTQRVSVANFYYPEH